MLGDRGHEEIRRQGHERARQDADLRHLRRRSVEVGLLRSIQAGDAKEHAQLPENPAAAGLRRPATRDRIDRLRVHRWFDEYSHTAPGGANHALDTFRLIMNHAIALGHAETNPTRDVKPNPRAALTRFLSLEEIACLHRILDRYASSRASRRRQADIIRLLLLTGCRKGEIVNLRWREVEGDTLNLADSKTGPRKVFLNTPARVVIERQPRMDSPFVFPSPRDPERACSPNLPLWYPVRRQAGIEDVRLHDLRHTFASHAVLQGIPLPVVSRLLGHKKPSMTLRYAHVGDRETEAAAERIGAAIARALDGSGVSQNDCLDPPALGPPM